eukprot:TRINITY_DN12485_c0_g1_i1.p1 TRINITY_DN12485_c0_g1~~TRINITY_DN12485_c0_g1_i1.p1  ORF type:complete len:390 (-),score=57.05 TRINITY_DN12485_c0_g1_i1:56-1225(-)
MASDSDISTLSRTDSFMDIDITMLPIEILHSLLVSLPIREIGRFARTCRELARVVADEGMWQTLCFVRYRQEVRTAPTWLETCKLVSLNRYVCATGNRFYRFHRHSGEEERSIVLPVEETSPAGVIFDRSVYLIGYSTTRVDMIWERAYQQKEIPFPVSVPQCALIDDVIYVCGHAQYLQRYRPREDSWLPPVDLPWKTAAGWPLMAPAAACNGLLYILGGIQHQFPPGSATAAAGALSTTERQQVDIFDHQTTKWRSVPLPSALSQGTACVVPTRPHIIVCVGCKYIVDGEQCSYACVQFDTRLETVVSAFSVGISAPSRQTYWWYIPPGDAEQTSCVATYDGTVVVFGLGQGVEIEVASDTVKRLDDGFWPRCFRHNKEHRHFLAIV